MNILMYDLGISAKIVQCNSAIMKNFVQNWDRDYEENTEEENNGYVVIKWNTHAIAQIRWEIECWRRGWGGVIPPALTPFCRRFYG